MNFVSKLGLSIKRHSPELLIAGSIASMVASIVLTGYSTYRLKKIIDPSKAKLENLRTKIKQIPDNNSNKEELSKNLKKDMMTEYVKVGGKILWLYSPAILTTALSITCMLGSHHIMKTRNVALASAYTILDNGFRAYRERVKEKIGEEAEEKIFSNKKKEKVEIIDENGKKKKVIVEKEYHDQDEDFRVMYDCGCNNWSKNALDNFTYLMGVQDLFNNRLRRKGYITLEEIYHYLGFSTAMLGKRKATASKYLGWVYDEKNKNLNNYISFGITYPGTRQALPDIQRQIDGNFPAFWLNFNVVGDILNDDNNPYHFTDYAKDDGDF